MADDQDRQEAEALREIEAMLRRRFGDDLRIRRTMPKGEELKETDSFLSMIGQAFGLHSWMWRTRKGALIACIVVPVTAGGLYGFYQPKIVAGFDLAAPYISAMVSTGAELTSEVVAFLPRSDAPFDPQTQGPAAIAPLTAGSFPRLTGLDAASLALAGAGGFEPHLPRMMFSGVVFRFVAGWVAATPLAGSPAPTAWGTGRQPLVYASENMSSAILETRLGLADRAARGAPDLVGPADLEGRVLLRLELSCNAILLDEVGALQSGFSLRDRQACQAFGDRWAQSGASTALIVPSRVLPDSRWVILNPAALDRSLVLVSSEALDPGSPPPDRLGEGGLLL